MGCSVSKLDNEVAVQLCKDRNKLIRETVECRATFASSNAAYIQAMEKVSAALGEYMNLDEPGELLQDSFMTPTKKTEPTFISRSPELTPLKLEPSSSCTVNYFMSSGSSSLTIEQVPLQSPKTFRVEVFSPPPLPPQSSQWDYFWDPFSSLDYYDYVSSSSPDLVMLKNEKEEVTKKEELCHEVENVEAEKLNPGITSDKEERMVEADEAESREEMEAKNVAQSISGEESTVSSCESKEEALGSIVYINQNLTSVVEIFKKFENGFRTACEAAAEISFVLDSSKDPHSSSSKDLSGVLAWNPVLLFRSSSSRSQSSRFTEEGYESSSEVMEASCKFYGNLELTQNKLYVWEKKLYQEVRAGVRAWIAYEKKCAQLRRNKDMEGKGNSFVDKTSLTIRELHSQIKVSIQTVQAVSQRIETLRDDEFQPQLLKLIQGFAKMWKIMAECHKKLKYTLDDAKALLGAKTQSKPSSSKTTSPHSVANLEKAIRNWRSCFKSWIVSQQFYVHAMRGWLSSGTHSDSNSSKSPFCPRGSLVAPPILNICIQWSEFLNSVSEVPVLEGLEFFAAGIGSLYVQKLKEESHCQLEGEVIMTPQEKAEIALKVLCDGMSVAVSSLTEFSASSAERYADLVELCDSAEQPLNVSK